MQADIVISAVGQPNLIQAGDIKEGAIVIDVGINMLKNNRCVGDVDFDGVSEKAGFITQVPNGVGLVTQALLFHNTVEIWRSFYGGEK